MGDYTGRSVLVSTLFAALAAAPSRAEPIKVFLLAGQSNMSGWTTTTGMPAAYTPNQPSVLIYEDGEVDATKSRRWLNNGIGFGHAAGYFGPELLFGKTISDSMPGTQFALIKYSVGGTNLAVNWRPPSSGGTVGPLYNNMFTTVTAALAALNTQYTPEWSGMLWMQGEFDAQNLTQANAYQTNLANLIRDVRSRLNVPALPFIIGMIDSTPPWPYAGIVRAAERGVAANTANVAIFDTRGYPTDNTHYLLNGMIRLGQDFARAWLSRFRSTALRPDFRPAPAAAFSAAQRNGSALLFCRAADCFALDGSGL